MKARLIGIGIFVAIAVGALVWQLVVHTGGNNGGSAGTQKKAVTLTGLVGGEKLGFLEDPLVKKRLLNKYGIRLNFTKAGSIEMVQGDTKGLDYLWPSSQIASEIFKNEKGGAVREDVIFNSPIVIYSWDAVAEALAKQGIVTRKDGTYYVTRFPRLVNLITTNTGWSSIGLSQLYGKMKVESTDPTLSNSGLMFAGLLGNVIAGGVVDESTLPKVLPAIRSYFAGLGFTQGSSGDLFDQYLTVGMGAKPMIVGYESQAIEFSLQNPSAWKQIRDKVRVLYPVPTVWTAHPLIALTRQGARLNQALTDPVFRRLAWERHGFRSGPAGTQNDPGKLAVTGVPREILQVVSMPSAAVMEKIIQSLEQTKSTQQ